MMKNHRMTLLGIILIMAFLFAIPLAFAISDSYDMGTTEVEYSHVIDKEFHNGRIAFSFQANDSLRVYISWYYPNASLATPIWDITGESGSIDISVDSNKNYYYFFSKITGYAVHIDFTLEGNPPSIPGFEILVAFLAVIGMIGLLSRKRQIYP